MTAVAEETGQTEVLTLNANGLAEVKTNQTKLLAKELGNDIGVYESCHKIICNKGQ